MVQKYQVERPNTQERQQILPHIKRSIPNRIILVVDYLSVDRKRKRTNGPGPVIRQKNSNSCHCENDVDDVDEEEISRSWVFYVQAYPLSFVQGPCFVHSQYLIGLQALKSVSSVDTALNWGARDQIDILILQIMFYGLWYTKRILSS